jgi:hypothetical protein
LESDDDVGILCSSPVLVNVARSANERREIRGSGRVKSWSL